LKLFFGHAAREVWVNLHCPWKELWRPNTIKARFKDSE